jgi:hypothetical protein
LQRAPIDLAEGSREKVNFEVNPQPETRTEESLHYSDKDTFYRDQRTNLDWDETLAHIHNVDDAFEYYKKNFNAIRRSLYQYMNTLPDGGGGGGCGGGVAEAVEMADDQIEGEQQIFGGDDDEVS